MARLLTIKVSTTSLRGSSALAESICSMDCLPAVGEKRLACRLICERDNGELIQSDLVFLQGRALVHGAATSPGRLPSVYGYRFCLFGERDAQDQPGSPVLHTDAVRNG